MSNTGRLAGKRILVTGTAGGQGKAAQRLFAEQGAAVRGCDVQDGKADATAAELRARGFDVSGAQVDLTDADAARTWIETSVDELGGLDVLYNNAAGFGFAPFADMDLELWRRVIHVELDIVFHTTSAAWPMLCGGGGSLINTASYSALRGSARLGQVAHAAAKGGVIAMTTSLAAEGAAHGVRANCISPGLVRHDIMGYEKQAWQLDHHLLRRPGEPVDIANLAVYLASDESSWVTGQNFSVDGGVTAGFRPVEPAA